MAKHPTVLDLNQLIAAYTNSQITPFKCKIVVSDNDSERRFMEQYIAANPPTSTNGISQTIGSTNNLFSNSLVSQTPSYGLSMYGTTPQPNDIEKYMKPIGEPGKCQIEVSFFKGLEMRSTFQTNRQEELVKEVEGIQKEMQEALSAIQDEVTERVEEVKERANKLDEKILTVLTSVGVCDEQTLDRFKDLLQKVENCDVEKKLTQLLGVVKEIQTPVAPNIFDEETTKNVTNLLFEEQEIIVGIGRQVTELRAKLEEMKRRHDKLNELH
ncbi:hypothetical protein EIN_369430 [Entamoeba invadens IP1]|uniref:Uncharacterized protein n=1 Tax=Entamoeba invadens IP1 TaxID=370355 RepID=A0A0A1UBL8_ENTIV|nr:hypothetical protein EIN_369430 [Entamoeba invadens IP1]ELP92621.1 hypothetical protein EIN_369430 [Entamoeba invadens IP1]|eukprot:XP_004259392.1 hypothetical protein EIN_369430 [Entamoeba invadens IP1]